MKKKLFAITGFALLLAVLGLASPAQAHDFSIAGPFACGPLYVQACGDGGPRDNHSSVIACDRIADGFGFVMQYRLRLGYQGTVRDGNGSASGCGWVAVTTSDNPVVWVRPCSDQHGVLICWQFGMDA